MTNDLERIERVERAERLKWARAKAGVSGPSEVSRQTGINLNSVKAHEQGRNGFGIADARRYARIYDVSLKWLFFGEGDPADKDVDPASVEDVPMISWISAGELGDQATVMDLSEFPPFPAIDLPEGEWIALRVNGPSMNKISPPESVIFVNLKDRRLVANACYVIADETGNATYKRFRPKDDPPFQPASYEPIDAPQLEGAIKVIGRVRRSLIEM